MNTQIEIYKVEVGQVVLVCEFGSSVEETVIETKFRNGMYTLVFASGEKLTQNGYSDVTVKAS